MKISAQAAMWMCALFAIVCAGFAFNGFTSLDQIADAADREASLGYAWFWMFLLAVAVVFGVLSWLIARGSFGRVE